jgi:hypothetical protein
MTWLPITGNIVHDLSPEWRIILLSLRGPDLPKDSFATMLLDLP